MTSPCTCRAPCTSRCRRSSVSVGSCTPASGSRARDRRRARRARAPPRHPRGRPGQGPQRQPGLTAPTSARASRSSTVTRAHVDAEMLAVGRVPFPTDGPATTRLNRRRSGPRRARGSKRTSPATPLPSFDTEVGFARHREWERTLWDGRWSAVSWPEEYGGRGADYLALAHLRGGVLPRRRARARQPERHLPPRAHDHGGGHRRAEGAVPPDDGVERDRVGAGVERTQRRLRPRRHPRHRRAQRRRLRVDAQRSEDLGVARGVGRLVLRHLPHRPRRRAPPRAHVRAGAARLARHHRASHRAARRRHRFRRDLLRRRARAGREHARRRQPGLAGRDGDGRLRARRQPAQPRPLQRDRRPAGRALAGARRSVRHRAARRGRRRVDAGRGLPAAHLHDGHADDRGRHHRRRGQPQQDLLERDGRAHPRARARHRSGPRPSAWTRPFERWVDGFLFSLSGPIYAGTNEIQRNIIADRVLQLPRGA